MTYGEYYYKVKYNMKLVDGTWVADIPKMKIPVKMSKQDATLYYTSKLRDYFGKKKE